MKHPTLLLVVLLICIWSCAVDDPDIESFDEPGIDELIFLAAEQITIGGTTLEFHASLWRDFMPISPPDGKKMISINWLVDVDSVMIPDNLLLERQYVILGDSLWPAAYTNEERPEKPPYLLERVSRDGPKWGPDVEVIVVAKVIDSNDNTEYYLIRNNLLIRRTD